MYRENSTYRARRVRFRRRGIALLAALLMLVLAATALAVVRGSALRRAAEAADAKEVADRVMDVNARDAEADFGVSIDELLWEGDSLCLSYTLSVPSDGRGYLCGVYVPRLNGERMALSSGFAIDGPMMSCELVALGGDYPVSASYIMELHVDGALRKLTDRSIQLRAAFMKTDRPIAFAGSFDDYAEKWQRQGAHRFKSADTLYYFDAQPVPRLCLDHYQPVYEAQLAHQKRYCAEIGATPSELEADRSAQRLDESTGLSAAELAETGIAQAVCERSVSVQLAQAQAEETRYNDLAQRSFETDAARVEITSFRLSRLGARFKGEFSAGDGAAECAGYTLLRPDGSELAKDASWMLFHSGDSFEGEIRGFVPLEGLEELLLAPLLPGDAAGCDLENAIVIRPIFNPDIAAAELNPTPEPTADPVDNDDLSSQ